MSLFASPEDHAANPPNTWKVVKVGRSWHLKAADGGTMDTFLTKRAAENARTQGHVASLYENERRWYAGERIPQWRMYAEVKAEKDRIKARWAVGSGE